MLGGKFERILVAIADPAAPLSKAVRRAGALAHKTGATVELLNAIPAVVSAGIAHAEATRPSNSRRWRGLCAPAWSSWVRSLARA